MTEILIEPDFEAVFDTIYNISIFLNATDINYLTVEDIEQVIKKAQYVEKLIDGLKEKQLELIFMEKLNEYYIFKRNCHCSQSIDDLATYCDSVLSKVLQMKPKYEIILKAIDVYLTLCNCERFEALVTKLSELRTLFIQLSYMGRNVFSKDEIKSMLLVQSWLKVLDNNEDGKTDVEDILVQLFTDANNVNIIIGIMLLEPSQDTLKVQNILIGVIQSNVKTCPSLASWKCIVESKHLPIIIQTFPQLLDTVLKSLEYFETRYTFDEGKNCWLTATPDDIEYIQFVKILKLLYTMKDVHYKMKKFIRIRQAKGAKEFWYYIQNKVL